MNKKICFFTVGFAFNKLVRLRYYEKIFPKNVEIFLITTDKYGEAKDERRKWAGLKRTNVIILRHSRKNLFEIRKIADKCGFTAMSNLGHPFGTFPLIFASLFRKRKVLFYILGDSVDYSKTDTLTKSGIKNLFSLIPYFFIEKFSLKTAFVGFNSFRKAPLFFVSPKSKFYYLHAPVNTEIFRPFDKQRVRKDIGIRKEEKVMIYVGRITKRKGGLLLKELIRINQDIKFIIIGRWNEKEIPKFNFNNMLVIEKVDNKDLARYYSSADLTFAYHKQGCQMGIVGEESLACGVPILHTERVYAKENPFIIKTGDSVEDANNKIRKFFKILKSERSNLSILSRNYAIKFLSDEYWKNKYLEFFLR